MIKNRFTVFTIIIVFILISSPSFADDSLSISDWSIDSRLLKNGDLEISEDLTFNFKDEYNGVFRNIILEGTDGISEIKLDEIIDGSEVPYLLNPNGEKGDTEIFKSEDKDNTKELMIFSPSNNEKKTFRIKYTLNNVAIKHKDTGEIYYKFIGEGNDTFIENFSATINLPSLNKNETKIFAHGPSNGEIFFSEDNKVKLEVSDVAPNTFIEARVLFPTNLLSSSTNEGNETLENILDEETSYADEIKEKAKNKSKMKNLFSNISIIITGLGTLLIGFIFNKLRRNTYIYNNISSLSPEDITPAELRLFYAKITDSRSLMATIFDLARKDYILIDESSSSKKKESNFILKIKSNSKDNLLPQEIYLMDWLFETIGNGEEVTTKDIEFHRKSSLMKFQKEFRLWQSKVKSDLDNKDYFDKSTRSTGVMLLFISLISLIISIISLVNNSYYGLASLALAISSFIYGLILMFRKSDMGHVQYEMWKDYKKDLERQGKTPKNYNKIIPRDKDLIYGLTLGLPMKSLNSFKSRISKTYMSSNWMYLYFLTNSKGGSKFEDSLNSSFYGSAGTTTSNSFGTGGGFSGGGGGGAGGGGAGGF